MRARDWTPFAVLSALILLYSTDFLTGDSAYLAIAESMWGNVDLADQNLLDYGHTIFRKANHLAVFFLLGLSTFPLNKATFGAHRLSVVCCATVALASEFVQVFSLTRHPAAYDVAVNLAAALLGLALAFHPPRLFRTVARSSLPLLRLRARPARQYRDRLMF